MFSLCCLFQSQLFCSHQYLLHFVCACLLLQVHPVSPPNTELWSWLWTSPCIPGTVTKTNRRTSGTWPPNIQTSSSTCTPASPEDLCKYLRLYRVCAVFMFVFAHRRPRQSDLQCIWWSFTPLTIITSSCFEWEGGHELWCPVSFLFVAQTLTCPHTFGLPHVWFYMFCIYWNGRNLS